MPRVFEGLWIAGSVLALLVGCQSEPAKDAPLDNRVEIPQAPDPSLGVQLVMPEFVVPAGAEVMWCWVSDWAPPSDLMINRFDSFQSELGGHHLVALGATVPFTPGHQFDCTNLDSMTALEPLVLPEANNVSTMPEGFAVRLPEASNVVIQSHYINYTDQDMVVRDVVHLGWASPDSDVIEASYLILNHGGLDLPPGTSSASVGCTLPTGVEEYRVTSLFGHMHEYGIAIHIGIDQGEGMETVYEIDQWEVGFRDEPPIVQWEPAAPLVLAPGDAFTADCSYDNPLDEPLRFPQEMCSAVALYHPAQGHGIIVCDDPLEDL